MKTAIYYLHRGDKIPFYVGKTNDIKNRLNTHKNVFGKEIFIELINEVDDWKYWEKHYINLFKNMGFVLENKNDGGGGPSEGVIFPEERSIKIGQANKGKTLTFEVKEKIRNKLKGRKLPQEQVEKIRIAKLGKPNAKKGKSDGPKPGVSKAHKGRISPNKGNIVIQYDLKDNIIQEWENMQKAANYYNINSESIRQCLRGISKTCVGYKWKYK